MSLDKSYRKLLRKEGEGATKQGNRFLLQHPGLMQQPWLPSAPKTILKEQTREVGDQTSKHQMWEAAHHGPSGDAWPHPQMVRGQLCHRGTLTLFHRALPRAGRPGIPVLARQSVRGLPASCSGRPQTVFCLLFFPRQTPSPSIINEEKVNSMEYSATKA